MRAHLANYCEDVPEEWRRHYNYILVNNLNDIPTDEPLNESNITLAQKWKKVAKVMVNQSELTTMDVAVIDEAITLAFVMWNSLSCN